MFYNVTDKKTISVKMDDDRRTAINRFAEIKSIEEGATDAEMFDELLNAAVKRVNFQKEYETLKLNAEQHQAAIKEFQTENNRLEAEIERLKQQNLTDIADYSSKLVKEAAEILELKQTRNRLETEVVELRKKQDFVNLNPVERELITKIASKKETVKRYGELQKRYPMIRPLTEGDKSLENAANLMVNVVLAVELNKFFHKRVFGENLLKKAYETYKNQK